MTLREQFDRVAEQIQSLDIELRRLAAEEANGHARPELYRPCNPRPCW